MYIRKLPSEAQILLRFIPRPVVFRVTDDFETSELNDPENDIEH